MKKIVSIYLLFLFIISSGFHAYANYSVPQRIQMYGENGNFSFEFVDTNNLESNINLKEFGDHISIETPMFNEINSEPVYTKLNLPNGAYVERWSDDPLTKDVIVIRNVDGDFLGLVDRPVVTLEDGTVLFGENTIDGNIIIHSFENDIIGAADNAVITTSVYAARPYTYYFYGIGYNNGGDKHDFWMQPIGHIFVSEKSAFGTYVSSWNSLDSGMRSILTGSDYTKWVNNPQTLEWQYACHYEIALPQGYWNLEEWRTPSSYTDVVLHGCNP